MEIKNLYILGSQSCYKRKPRVLQSDHISILFKIFKFYFRPKLRTMTLIVRISKDN